MDEHASLADVIVTVDPKSEHEDIAVYLTDLPRRGQHRARDR